jgi:pimeloyl-ACP methyl ester carboxylesterase
MSSRAKKTSAAPQSKPLPIEGVIEQRPTPPRHGFAVGCDGTPIYFRVRGPADAPLVVLCDGIGCDGYVWKYLERELGHPRVGAEHPPVRLLHWHYRGHGRSAMPRDRRRVDIVDLADDLAAVIEAAGGAERPALLAGHSMGVQVCLEAFRRHRDRVGGLLLLCGSYGTPLRTFKGQRTLEQVLPYVRFLVNRIPGVVSSLWTRVIPTELAYQIAVRFELNGELIRRDDFFPYLEHMSRIDARLFLEMLAAAGRHSCKELLQHIDVPTLIVAGDRDGFTPPHLSREMHELIPGAELHVVAGGSHTAPIERPAEVAERVAAFLRKLF